MLWTRMNSSSVLISRLQQVSNQWIVWTCRWPSEQLSSQVHPFPQGVLLFLFPGYRFECWTWCFSCCCRIGFRQPNARNQDVLTVCWNALPSGSLRFSYLQFCFCQYRFTISCLRNLWQVLSYIAQNFRPTMKMRASPNSSDHTWFSYFPVLIPSTSSPQWHICFIYQLLKAIRPAATSMPCTYHVRIWCFQVVLEEMRLPVWCFLTPCLKCQKA